MPDDDDLDHGLRGDGDRRDVDLARAAVRRAARSAAGVQRGRVGLGKDRLGGVVDDDGASRGSRQGVQQDPSRGHLRLLDRRVVHRAAHPRGGAESTRADEPADDRAGEGRLREGPRVSASRTADCPRCARRLRARGQSRRAALAAGAPFDLRRPAARRDRAGLGRCRRRVAGSLAHAGDRAADPDADARLLRRDARRPASRRALSGRRGAGGGGV